MTLKDLAPLLDMESIAVCVCCETLRYSYCGNVADMAALCGNAQITAIEETEKGIKIYLLDAREGEPQ